MSSGTGDKLEGKVDEFTGNVKQGVGKATGDSELEAEGQMDEAAGKGKGLIGGAKDALQDAGDAIGDVADAATNKPR